MLLLNQILSQFGKFTEVFRRAYFYGRIEYEI